LPVYDAIYNSEYFDFVLPRHEQGAGHMAEGYARARFLLFNVVVNLVSYWLPLVPVQRM
jgi:glyoxylate carboligase